MLDAAAQVACGDEEKAMSLLASAVAAAPPGPFGWTLPIDPVFAPLRDRPELTQSPRGHRLAQPHRSGSGFTGS